MSDWTEYNWLITNNVQYSICTLYKVVFEREELRKPKKIAKDKQPWEAPLHTKRQDLQYEA